MKSVEMTQSDYEGFNGGRERWVDLRLATILGHQRAAAALRQRVLRRHHDTGIILHGPPSVGKRTVARLYARALLCERPTETGEACGQCAECQSFLVSRPIGYYELDTTRQGDEATAHKLVRELKEASFAAKRVVVIGNADQYKNSAFDVLLKTI